jgi:hypothetical protein
MTSILNLFFSRSKTYFTSFRSNSQNRIYRLGTKFKKNKKNWSITVKTVSFLIRIQTIKFKFKRINQEASRHYRLAGGSAGGTTLALLSGLAPALTVPPSPTWLQR